MDGEHWTELPRREICLRLFYRRKARSPQAIRTLCLDEKKRLLWNGRGRGARRGFFAFARPRAGHGRWRETHYHISGNASLRNFLDFLPMRGPFVAVGAGIIRIRRGRTRNAAVSRGEMAGKPGNLRCNCPAGYRFGGRGDTTGGYVTVGPTGCGDECGTALLLEFDWQSELQCRRVFPFLGNAGWGGRPHGTVAKLLDQTKIL